MTNKTVIKFTLILYLLSAFTFCKKEKLPMIVVSGFIYSSSTKQPLSGQEVVLEAHEIIPSNPSIEFPNGTPSFRKQKTHTDSKGRYSFTIHENQFLPVTAYLGSGEYAGEIFKCYPGFSMTDPGCLNCISNQLPCTNYFDTLYAEKAGYIRFTIKNTGSSFFNDSLFVKKSYYARHTEYLGIGWGIMIFGDGISHKAADMGFAGATVNKVIIDTIPAERIRKQYIEWIYKRTDTISVQRDSIAIAPGSIVDYAISY